jgi:predicted deacylase
MARTLGPIPLPAPGEKAAGEFTFEADPELARHRWPYFAIAGTRSGPTFLVTAGIHAAEYTGIEAAIRLGRRLGPAAVRGTLVVIPLLNRPGFYERSVYVNPVDGQNMNRMFPGDPAGSWSERFAHHFLEGVVVRCDALVDLHAGDLIEDLEPFVIWRETGDAALDARTRRMVDAYGVRWAVRALPSGERPGLLYAAAAERGVAAMIAESGRCGLLEEAAVVCHVRGVLNALRAAGVVGGRPRRVARPRVLDRFDWVRSPAEGIFHASVRVGQRVRRDQALGEMVDLLGAPLAVIRAPSAGVVLFVVTSPAIRADGLLLGIGVR